MCLTFIKLEAWLNEPFCEPDVGECVQQPLVEIVSHPAKISSVNGNSQTICNIVKY